MRQVVEALLCTADLCGGVVDAMICWSKQGQLSCVIIVQPSPLVDDDKVARDIFCYFVIFASAAARLDSGIWICRGYQVKAGVGSRCNSQQAFW